MKCPFCIKEEKRSTIRIGTSISTALAWSPFYDEDGGLHHHNPNHTVTDYHCSNDHVWTESTKQKCWCGYNEE